MHQASRLQARKNVTEPTGELRYPVAVVIFMRECSVEAHACVEVRVNCITRFEGFVGSCGTARRQAAGV